MRSKQTSKILALLMAVSLVFTMMPTSVFASNDTSAPDIGIPVANPGSAQPGDTVTISATVTDESEIKTLTLSAFDLNYNDIAYDLPMNQQAETDIYQVEIMIPADVVNGNCIINIYAEDEHGNGITVQFWENVLMITAGASDTTAPVIDGALTVSPTSVQPNETFTASTTVTDDSDIVSVSFNAVSQQGSTAILKIDMIRQDSSNTYQTTFTFPSDAVNGDYTVTIDAEDKYGNRSSKEFTSAFTVTGGHDDISGPVIGDTLTVSPQYVLPGGTVTVSTTVTDATAVDEVVFSAFIDQIIIAESMIPQGDTDTYQGTFTVPFEAITGRNASILIVAYDTYGNLTEKRFEEAFMVTADDSTATTYTATLNIQVDGMPNAFDGNGYTLKLSNDETKTVTMNGEGSTRTASVPDGEWKVYGNWNDKYTGVTITVSGGNASATLDWFSSEYRANPEGTATSGTIGVTLNGESIFDDAAFGILNFIKGDRVTFTANGFGADSYTYVWSGSHNGSPISATGKIYTIESVSGKMNLTCTITGSGAAETYTVTISSQGTGSSGGGEYTQGTTVNISAGTPPSDTGFAFKNWTSTPTVCFADENNANTSFIMPAQPVTVTANFGATPAGEKAIFVLSDGNGTASADVNSAVKGATITLTTIANSGYYFKEWQVIAGGVTIQEGLGSPDGTTMYHSFTMPDTEVRVKAIFDRIPAITYTVTFDPNGGALIPSSAETDTDGKLSSLPMPERSGSYRFDGWYTAASGGTKVTISTVFSADTTIYAHWTYIGGSGSSSGGGGSSSSSRTTVTTPPATPEQPKPITNAKTDVEAKVDGSGKAMVRVPEKVISDAIQAAQKADTNKNGISVTVSIQTDKVANSITVTLLQNTVNELIKAGVTELRIESDTVNITLDLTTLKQIQAVGGNVTVNANKISASTLSKEAQATIGNRPVFDLSLMAGGKAVSSFNGGSVSMALHYTLSATEKVSNLFGVYVDENGKVTYLTNSSYDANAKLLQFSTGHFSIFGIGYKEIPAFTDIATHWAKDDILLAAGRGLLTGTSATTFEPNSSMTRGMFVTALGRLAGIDSTKYRNTKFTDVTATAHYAPYTAWAAEKGITSGTTATSFSPDKAITRQEMSVLMVNYAKVMGYNLPKTREGITFTDSDKITSWAKDEVKSMQMAGVLNGKDGNRFDPAATTTRAEVASMLRRYVELVIDTQTAQGLDKNDSTYDFNLYGEAALPTKKTGTYTVQRNDSFWMIAKKQGCTMDELSS